MTTVDEDQILIEQIKTGWGPPTGGKAGFDEAGRRVRLRRTRSRQLRYGVGVFLILLIGLAAGLTTRAQRDSNANWIAYTAAGRTVNVDLPPEYEALMGTIYGQGNSR